MNIAPLYPQTNYSEKTQPFAYHPTMTGYKMVSKIPSHNENSDKLTNCLRNYFLGYSKRINYTWQHKKAFLEVEKELCGKNSLQGYLHDADKLFMYLIGVPKELAHNIHVATAPHHVRNGKVKNPLMAVVDWECARYTKPDKPLSAREYYENFFVKGQGIKMPEVEAILDKFGL